MDKHRMIDLPSQLSLTGGDNVNYYKSVDPHIPTVLLEIGNT